ncbi:MAG: RNA chaperone ProQ [Glaciecola sp.]
MEQQKLTNQKETLAFLQQKYPNCFVSTGNVKPLKIGIFQDLANELTSDVGENDVVSKRLLRMSLRHYTSSWRYLAAVKTGVPRVDLSGAEGELVEAQHAEHAAEQLKESKAKAAKAREASKGDQAKTRPSKHKGYVGKSDGAKSRSNIAPAANGKSSAVKKQHGKTKNASKPAPKSAAKPIEALSSDDLSIGAVALVKLGKDPMPVTITDISKDGIAVQLNSGMTVKVQQAQLYKHK